MKIKSDKEHFINCNVAGFTYHEGCEVLNQMKFGDVVTLVREDENEHDSKAVALFFNDVHIGYIPRNENDMLAKLMDLGWGEMFEARIQSLDPTAHPEHQIGVIVYIKRRKDNVDKGRSVSKKVSKVNV